ncbi:MAG: hypothetical protein VKN33_00645 [Candidatus Sericytochromatia bacterium]|nr:hypothetical protein [Candidatus Sericytochromatia bacterium]
MAVVRDVSDPLALRVALQTAQVSFSVSRVLSDDRVLQVPPPAVRSKSEWERLTGLTDSDPILQVRSALRVAREVRAVKRLVPAHELSTAQVIHWLGRIADARRISHLRLELVGIFPRLPLASASHLQLDAVREEARYTLSEGGVTMTTVAVAKRRDTGESVVARLVVDD